MTKEIPMTNPGRQRIVPLLSFGLCHSLIINASSLVIATVTALCLMPVVSNASDTNSILDQWFSAQQNVATWSADFTQIREFRALAHPLTAAGKLYFSAPGDFRWELGRPAQTIALRHGDEMFVIYPALKRAERYPMGATAPRQLRDTMSLLQVGMPHSRKEFGEQFQLLSLVATNATWRLTLQPKSAGARQMLPELQIDLATNDFSLAATALVFADGSRMENDYTNIAINPPLDRGLFQWQPPDDFKVTSPVP